MKRPIKSLTPFSLVCVDDTDRLLLTLYDGRSRFSSSIDTIFHVIPGVEEFCRRLAYFLNTIPSEDGSGLFLKTLLVVGVSAIEDLGLFPVTIHAHLNGYHAFVRAVLSHATLILDFDVKNQDGDIWHPLSGPLSEFAKPSDKFFVQRKPFNSIDSQKHLFRTVLLAHCATFPQLAVAAPTWASLAE
jgi:hypothetical protein